MRQIRMGAKRSGYALLAVASALGITGVSRNAFADGARCEGVRISSRDNLPAAWASAIRDVQREVSPAASGGCAAVEVHAELEESRILVLTATSPDGRRTSRLVNEPSAVTPTVIGLVASIPEEAPEAALSPTSTGALTPSAASPPAAPSGERIEVWLGAAAGGRVAQPLLVDMLDFEGRADVLAGPWLAFASFRYAAGVTGDGDDASSYSETDFGIGAGRSFSIGRAAIDAAIVPSLATSRYDDQKDEALEGNGSVTQFRIGASVRLSIPVTRWLHLTMVADTEMAPAGLDHPVSIPGNSLPLPAWTGGLRVGVSGKLL